LSRRTRDHGLSEHLKQAFGEEIQLQAILLYYSKCLIGSTALRHCEEQPLSRSSGSSGRSNLEDKLMKQWVFVVSQVVNFRIVQDL
jgi:hypothetical protein